MRALGLEPRTQGLKVNGASTESQCKTNACSGYDSGAVVSIAKLLLNLGSCLQDIEAMADRSTSEFEQLIRAEALNDL